MKSSWMTLSPQISFSFSLFFLLCFACLFFDSLMLLCACHRQLLSFLWLCRCCACSFRSSRSYREMRLSIASQSVSLCLILIISFLYGIGSVACFGRKGYKKEVIARMTITSKPAQLSLTFRSNIFISMRNVLCVRFGLYLRSAYATQ